MPQIISPVVAEVSPNLELAAQRANLTPRQRNHVEQMSWTVKKNKELIRMPVEDARKEYDSLEPDAKESLKFFFKEAEYMKPAPGVGDKLWGAFKGGLKFAASPLIYGLKAAGEYNRLINTPYLVGRQTAQGENIFDKKVWSDAWSGKDLYDSKALDAAIKTFGKGNVFVAQGLLEGLRPGEILEKYGKVDATIADAIEKAFNDPDNFKQVLDATKYAQFSPGRDIARGIFSTGVSKNGSLGGDYISGGQKNVSGVIDFIYQIAIDPLTWVTGGTSKAATRGTQLREIFEKTAAATGSNHAATRVVFKDEGVRKLWDNVLGPRLKRYAEAEGELQKGLIRREIGRAVPGYNNDEAITFLAKNGVFNAAKAEQIFGEADNFHFLLSGRLDGIGYHRNGIVTARSQRRLTSGLLNYLDSVFNATPLAIKPKILGIELPVPSTVANRGSLAESEATLANIYKGLSAAGERIDQALNPNLADVLELDKDINKLRYKVGRWLARNPAGQQIIVGDDAALTADSVRQVARLVFSRDFADGIVQHFLKSSEDERVVVLRNLYGAVMLRAGLGGTPEGEAVIRKTLENTLKETAGFGSTVETVIPSKFASVLSPATVKIENNVTKIRTMGPRQPSQLSAAVRPLPLEEIMRASLVANSKKDLVSAIGGATNSKFIKDFTDFWSVFTLFPRLGIRSAIDEGFMYYLTAPGKELLKFVGGIGNQLGRAATVYTGSKSSYDPVVELYKKATGKTILPDQLGPAQRSEIIKSMAEAASKKSGIPVDPSELRHLDINKNIAEAALNVFNEVKDPRERLYLVQAMIHHAEVLNSIGSSLIGRTGLSGGLDKDIAQHMITNDEFSRAISEVSERFFDNKEIIKSGTFDKIITPAQLKSMDESIAALPIWDNFMLRFGGDSQHGKIEFPNQARLAPAIAFFNNNFLKTDLDFERAVDDVMLGLGMIKPAGPDVNFKAPEILNVRMMQKGEPLPENSIYIGRANQSFGLPGSKYGNPFPLEDVNNDAARAKVIEQYEIYARMQLAKDPNWLDDLRGKDLVDWCSPKACHGDVLSKLLKEQAEGKANVVIHSGGARGSDTAWSTSGDKHGFFTIAHSYAGHAIGGGTPLIHSPEELAKANLLIAKIAKKLNRPINEKYANLLRRNYYQVKDSDAVIAVGRILSDKNIDGGTGWAVAMGQDKGVPTFVYDLNTFGWKQWVDNDWIAIDKPPIFKNFAGVGTREPGKEGLRAISNYLDYVNKSVNAKPEGIQQGWKINPEKPEAPLRFISQHGDTVFLRKDGLTDDEIVRMRVETMLLDLYDNFHGGPENFNGNLATLLTEKVKAMVEKEKQPPVRVGDKLVYPKRIQNKWQKAVESLTLEEFTGAIKGYMPEAPVQTRLEIPGFYDAESTMRRYGNTMFEVMDRQVNAIFRQPAVWLTYTRVREGLSGVERNWKNAKYFAEIEADNARVAAGGIAKYDTEKARERLIERIGELGEKRFTELALNEAADTVLKYADNPSVRTNFAVSVRTVGRFYRATEDFWRRMYRLKDVSPRVLYRMRLAHLGLESSGLFHEDPNGDKYIIMPMDNIIFKATDGTMRALTGNLNSEYKVPKFNDFTLKLSLLNPSFQQDSGVPTFSGPVAALGVMGVRNILGQFDDPSIKKLGVEADNYLLGGRGNSNDFVRALMPSTLTKIWSILPFNEKSRQETTAVQQAIAYNAANGLFLNGNSTSAEKYEYLKQLRISAHNVVALRSFLGLISPVAPSQQDSKGVPDYLLDVGITSLKSEYYDIVDAIKNKYGSDVQDPYELALTIFMGQNPGKLVYTVSDSEKSTKVALSKVNQTKSWVLANQNYIDKYGDSAYIFAPQMGEFSASAWTWLQSAGLIKEIGVEKYLDNVLIAQDKKKYYDIADWEKNALANELTVSGRKEIIARAASARSAMRTSNPLLADAIMGPGGNEIATEEAMLKNLRALIDDRSFNINEGTRTKMQIAVKAMEDFRMYVGSSEVKSYTNGPELKRQYRRKIEELLDTLGNADPAVKEATRSVFESILSFYSRDTYKAVPNG